MNTGDQQFESPLLLISYFLYGTQGVDMVGCEPVLNTAVCYRSTGEPREEKGHPGPEAGARGPAGRARRLGLAEPGAVAGPPVQDQQRAHTVLQPPLQPPHKPPPPHKPYLEYGLQRSYNVLLFVHTGA